MSILANLTLEELTYLEAMINNQALELQSELNNLIEEKRNQKALLNQYQSSRLPEYYEQYKDQCSFLLSQLTERDVPFFTFCAYKDAGNNKGGWLDICLMNPINNIGNLEKFFDENDGNIYLYEGAYNTLNYLKSSICTLLKDGKRIECKDDLMKDQEEKQVIITKSLRQIAEELLLLRESVPRSRLSVANQGLSRTAKKTSTSLTFTQNLFIEAIALGSSLEDLKVGNYDAAKRLLFVPQPRRIEKEITK